MAERRRSMKLTELREQAIEALEQTPYIDVIADDESSFRVWHPLLVDDDSQARIDRFNAGEDLDKDENGQVAYPARIKGKLAEPAAVRSSRAILGPDVHKAFIKAGGHSNDIQLAWNEMVREHREANDLLSAVDADPK
jgi:hypothetical protein